MLLHTLTSTRSMNLLLAAIDKEGAKFGLELNRGKCQVMHTGLQVGVHFAHGTKVTRKAEVKYLGCLINSNSNVDKEFSGRIANAMAIRNKLQMF